MGFVAKDHVRAAGLAPVVRVGNLSAMLVCRDTVERNDSDVETICALAESVALDFQSMKGGVVVADRADAVVGVADIVVSKKDVVVPVFQQQRRTALVEDVVFDHDMIPSAL